MLGRDATRVTIGTNGTVFTIVGNLVAVNFHCPSTVRGWAAAKINFNHIRPVATATAVHRRVAADITEHEGVVASVAV